MDIETKTYSMASFLGGKSDIIPIPTLKEVSTPQIKIGKGDIQPFMVDDVKVYEEEMKPIDALTATRARLTNEVVEAAGFGEYPVVKLNTRHGFISAVGMAFDQHRPLSLAPSHFWLLIAQGVAKHIELHAERLRSTFVDHEGREYIEVRRDHFVKGNPDNDWPGCFEEFSQMIQEKTKGPYAAAIVKPFSTTSAVEQAALEVTLMDAMKDYFEYGCRTCCGFPRIYMEGSVQDWEDLHSRVSKMGLMDPENKHFQTWSSELTKLTQKLVDSAHGKPDKEHWRSFFKLGGGSGGPFINGWINVFFPYTEERGRWIPYSAAVDWKGNRSWGGGNNISDMPAGLSAAPFIWHYYDMKYKMKFVAGFLGVEQVPKTTALRPGIGWATTDTQQESPASVQKRLLEKVIAFNEPREEEIRRTLLDQIRRMPYGDSRNQLRQKIWDERNRFLISVWDDDHGRKILTDDDLVRPENDKQEYQDWLDTSSVDISVALEKFDN